MKPLVATESKYYCTIVSMHSHIIIWITYQLSLIQGISYRFIDYQTTLQFPRKLVDKFRNIIREFFLQRGVRHYFRWQKKSRVLIELRRATIGRCKFTLTDVHRRRDNNDAHCISFSPTHRLPERPKLAKNGSRIVSEWPIAESPSSGERQPTIAPVQFTI